MSTSAELQPRGSLETADQRVVLHGVSWDDYERFLAVRGENGGVRMTYLRGELELMSPSRGHEGMNTRIGRLLEAYAEERGLELEGFGSWTLRSQPKERGVEPDKCYILGPVGDREIPDLAIEVEWSKGLVDKLEVYRGLGVAEVWVWRKGEIAIQVLRKGRYERAKRSVLVPELDLGILAKHLEYPTQTQAVRAFRTWLRGASPK